MSDVVGQPVERLVEVIDSVASEQELPTDVWTGKRGYPRRTLIVPITIRIIEQDGSLGPATTQWLQNISESGISITSHHKFDEDQILHVEICVNGTMWGGEMRVVHCTGTVSGYKFGLELKDPLPAQSTPSPTPWPVELERRKQPRILPDPTHRFRRAQRTHTWLEQAKAEIRKATRAYNLARRTWGLLGVSIQKQIKKVIEQFPGQLAPAVANERRKLQRHRTNVDAHLVVHSSAQWRQFPARIVDISEGGLKVEVNFQSSEDPAEWELHGEFSFYVGMAIVVGLGAEPNTLWVPAEVVRCGQSDGELQHLGVKFNTEKALEAFEGAIRTL